MTCTFEQLLFTDTMGVGLRGGWRRSLWCLAAGRGGFRRLRVEEGQQGAAVVPAGVVGEVGAYETISELQLLIHGHARHLHHHPAVVPAVNWGRHGMKRECE